MSFSARSEGFVIYYFCTDNFPEIQATDTVRIPRIEQLETYNSNYLDSLFNNGFLAASVDSILYDLPRVNCFIHRGNKYEIAEINISSMSAKELRRAGINKKHIVNKVFSTELLKKINYAIIKYYANNSYPFCKAVPHIRFVDEKQVSLNIDIFKNKFIKFGDIKIKGNVKSSYNFITNFLNIKKDKNYNESLVSEVENKLKELEYFEITRAPLIEFIDDKADVYLYLKDKSAGMFNGVAGFVPDSLNDNKLTITGEVDLAFKNLFGNSENISLHWQRIAAGSQQLNINFSYPYLFGLPLEPLFGFELDKTDSSYLNLNIATGFAYLLPNNDKIPVTYSYFSSNVFNPQENTTLQNTSHRLLNIGYESKHYDYLFNPSRGYSVRTLFGTGLRIVDKEKINIYKVDFVFDYYLPLYKRFVFRGLVEYNSLFSPAKLSENEVLKFGGYKSMRGFDENQFLTEKSTRISGEFRFLYEKNAATYIFYDAGFISDKNNKLQFLQGFGFGVEISTKAGRINFAYALNKEKDKTLKLIDSKVHLAFVNRF